MEWNIVTVFPIEIWEKIVLFCDGETLLVLPQVNDTFQSIITSLDQVSYNKIFPFLFINQVLKFSFCIETKNLERSLSLRNSR